MEEVSRKLQKASTYSIVTLRAHKGAMHRMSAKASTPTGRWGGFMKVSTYISLVGVDVAIVERHCATSNVDATSKLPNNGGMSMKTEHPSRWGGFMM